MTRPRPYDKTTHDGKTVDWLTHAALLKAERILGYKLTIVQGSYNAGSVAASAGTHDGGGCVDLKATDALNKVKAMRASGFWAWLRPDLPGVWTAHLHCVQEGNRKLAPIAARQVEAGKAGRDGLANNGPDPHAGIPVVPFVWPYYGPVGRLRWVRDNLTGRARRRLNRQIDKLAGER